MNKIVAILLTFGALACHKEVNDSSIIYGYEYFPTEIGSYKTYDVVEIFHDVDLLPQHDTMRYQIKEVLTEELIDDEGDTIQKIKRYVRESDTSIWIIQDIWTQKRTSTTAEVVGENGRVIKLVFAIAYDRFWNGNALNSSVALNSYYEDIYLPYTLNEVVYDSTVRVEKEDFLSFIDYRREYEIYARNIGLIKSVYKNLKIDNQDTLDIQKGPELFYSLIDFGTE